MISVKYLFYDNELLLLEERHSSETSGHQFGYWSASSVSAEEELETRESAVELENICLNTWRRI